ncbi:hypothetical protein GJ744_010150 [Endocarpon pusillum]|uniref:Fumarate lyase N-terminal domain-containing protein n=1 Tax=Endocarpon pusillum TaxID=364733 RepID=A0A8H7AIG8_9EURO|nr:hypothetical protein GJ744_010150 [Endocarpon pusillum]
MPLPAKNENSVRLWGGRFTGEMDPLMDQYNESLSLDRVFHAQDIKGSIAYARANVKAGILTQEEFGKLEEGLKKVLKEWDEGKFQPAPGDEGEQAPVHMPFVLPPCWSLSRAWRLYISNQEAGYQVGSDVTKYPFPEINC